MQQRVSIITLGVKDLGKAKTFYAELGWRPVSDEGSIVFYQLNNQALALYPWDDLAKDAQVTPESKGFRGITLAYNVNTPEEVQPIIDAAVAAGGKQIKPAQDVFWGGHSGYFSDLDGHLWEVAHNPFTLVDEKGSFIMESSK